jgi:fucose permease
VSPAAGPGGPSAARRRALGALAQADMFVFGIVMALIGAVVPSLTARLAITLGDIGALFLVMNGAMLVASLVLGLVMDRFGLRTPLAAGAWLVAAGLALVASADRYAVLLPAVACLGLGGGALNGGANTLVADLHDDAARKGAALNLLGVFFGFGALLLPFSLGALTSALGTAALLRVAAVACVLVGTAAVVLGFPPPKQLHGWPLASMSRFVRMPEVLAMGALLFFQSGSEFTLGGYLATMLTREAHLSLDAASYGLAAYWATIMGARMLLSRVLPAIGAPGVVLGSAVASAGGALIVASANSPAMAVAGTVVTGCALAGIFPTVLGLAGARFEEHSGTVFGLLFAMALCGGMSLPWLAGHLAEAAGVRAVFVLTAVNFAAIAVLGAAATRMLAARS